MKRCSAEGVGWVSGVSAAVGSAFCIGGLEGWQDLTCRFELGQKC